LSQYIPRFLINQIKFCFFFCYDTTRSRRCFRKSKKCDEKADSESGGDRATNSSPEISVARPYTGGNVVAFVNMRSGVQNGAAVTDDLANLLGKDFVFDLSQDGPRSGLERHKHTKDLRVIACGGDGTVGWYSLSVLKKD
jgi:hypothetical protein